MSITVACFARENNVSVREVPDAWTVAIEMGEGYGWAAREFFQEQAADAIVDRLGGNVALIVSVYVEGDYDSSGYESRSETNVHAMALEISDWKYGDLDAIKTMNDLHGQYADMVSCQGAHLIGIMTEKEQAEIDAEKRRKELEADAAKLCARHKVKAGSLAFLDAVQDEISAHRSTRYGMREDGLCSGAGMTADQWFDEYNAIGGDISHLYDILDWMSEQCPLLFAQWQEKRATADAVELQDA